LPPLLIILLLCDVGFTVGFLGVYMSRQRKGRRMGATNVTRLFGRHKRGGGGGGRPVITGTVTNAPHIKPLDSATPVYRTPTLTTSEEIGTYGRDGTKTSRKKEVAGTPAVATKSKGKPLCPYCQTPCDPSTGKVCPECHTVHHKECWEEYGGCTILGCKHGPTKN